MIKLAIVDDDLRLIHQIKDELKGNPEIEWIQTHVSGLAYVKWLSTQLPDLVPDCVLMDISMHVADEGIQATRILTQEFPQIKVIMFTISDDDDIVFEAFKAGALGYLLKNEKPTFILRTLTEVNNGGASMSPSIALKTIRFLTNDRPPFPVSTVKAKEENNLTERELEVLRLMSRGTTYQVIADQLFISHQTVKKHVSNVFHKLHVKNKVEALLHARDLL